MYTVVSSGKCVPDVIHQPSAATRLGVPVQRLPVCTAFRPPFEGSRRGREVVTVEVSRVSAESGADEGKLHWGLDLLTGYPGSGRFTLRFDVILLTTPNSRKVGARRPPA
jgi:hypothetical protein